MLFVDPDKKKDQSDLSELINKSSAPIQLILAVLRIGRGNRNNLG